MRRLNAGQRVPWFRRGIAGFMLALFVSVHAMAAVHVLHESVCEHAESADHHCAATLLAAGQIEVPIVAVEVSPVEFPLPIQSPVSLPIFVSTDRPGPPGRAPPVSFL